MVQHNTIDHTGLTGVSTVSYASNANSVATANAGGAASTVTRGDHVHLGVRSISHASNTYSGPITFTTEGDLGITSPSSGTLAFKAISGAGGGGAAATSLQSGRVVRTAGDVTLTGTTAFTDLTGASITLTTGARKVLLTFTCSAFINNAGGTFAFDFDIDGARASGADFGFNATNQHSTASEGYPVGMSFLTDTLTAASHTFKVQWKIANAAHTGTVQAATAGSAYVFAAVELYA